METIVDTIFSMKIKFLTWKTKTFCLVASEHWRHYPNDIFISFQDAIEDKEGGEGTVDTTAFDLKNMKVAELRAELEARGLPSKGKWKSI